MSKPSVVRAFNATVLPHLTAIGFRRSGSKKYVRVRDGICQFLFLHVETRMRREFMLEYSTMLICQPHDFENLDHGGRFPDGKNGRWYPAHSEDRLTESVNVVADQLFDTLVPWYESCISLQGFIDTYGVHAEQQYPALARNGHTQFTLACAHARNCDVSVATTHAKQAIADYNTIYKDRPVCDWAKNGAAWSRQLLTGLIESTFKELLGQWRSHTIESLKLAPVVTPEHKG